VAPGARGFDKAFAWAAGLSRDVEKRVLVQEHVEGADYRILVIGKQRVYGVRCEPAHVVGSGEHTIADLIEDWNYGVLVDARKIRIDRTLERQIALEGFTLASVPPNNAVVWLSRRANTHRGAFAHDCTELLGDEVIERCIGIAEAFGADHVGVDIISPDITHDAGVVIELNPHAAMTLHTQPTTGKARNVPAAVVDSLFPTSR
jgi:cyanophycin synthetase